MKRFFILALIALMMLASALAEEQTDFWTRNEDFYYHINPACRGMENAVPISVDAARAFDKYICPVCIQGTDDASDVQAAVRGGTIVLRFSDAWLNEKELTGVFGWSGETTYRGREGERLLTQYLHGEAYNRFMDACAGENAAAARARIPYILATNGELIMNRRHIGSAWYIVVRPQVRFGESWNMYWRINGMNLRAENGTFYTSFEQQTEEAYKEVTLQRMDSTEPVYAYAADDMEISVYRALDGNVAVIYRAGTDASLLTNMELCIGNEAVELSGYTDGGRTVYCCVLTDGELAAMQGGVQPRMVRLENINSRIYRITDGNTQAYRSRESDALILQLEMEGGVDPLDAHYRVLVDGEAQRIVIAQPGNDWLLDMAGNNMIQNADGPSQKPERITPLIWSGDQGVFLAESCYPAEFKPGEKLLADGFEYGKRYSLSDQYDTWYCWLMDQDGNDIGPRNNWAFTIYENGEIHMEDITGAITVHQPIVLND